MDLTIVMKLGLEHAAVSHYSAVKTVFTSIGTSLELPKYQHSQKMFWTTLSILSKQIRNTIWR